MRLGIFARTFERSTLGEALDAVRASGIGAIQFNMALAGGPSLPAIIPRPLADETRAAVAARGLEIAAVSGTYNMAHPDARVRRRGAAALAELISTAPRLGAEVVTLCTGTRDAEDLWRAHPDNGTPAAWRDAVEAIAAAVAIAERHGVVLAFEPEHNNVVRDARAGRRLLDEVDSDHLKVVLDAANLIEPGELPRQRETLREAFTLLGDSVVLAHAKDVREDGAVVPAGRGGLDYRLYVELLQAAGYDGPLVLHGLTEAEVPSAARFVREHLGVGAAR